VSTPNDALTYAKRFIGSFPIDDSALIYRLLDDAHKKLWMADNWQWSVGAMETVTMVNDQQDYNLSSAPSDFAYMLNARLLGTDTDQTENELIITSVLPVSTALKGIPKRISYVTGTPSKVRVLPTPHGYTNLPVVLPYYKRTPVTVGAGNVSSDYFSVYNIPAYWFYVYQEMVLLKAYNFVRDPRAGSATFVNGGVQYTGQYAVVEAAIQEMKSREKKLFDIAGAEVRGNG